MMNKPNIITDKNDLPQSVKIIEFYENALRELFFIDNPKINKDDKNVLESLSLYKSVKDFKHIWIYYPEEDVAIHTVDETEIFKLRTSRNRNIISEKEQTKLRDLKVGIAGLSVGSAVLQALVLSGGPKNLKIADFDTLELSNLNRIRASLLDLGKNKAEISAKNVWSIDPFANVEIFENGIDKNNLDDFFNNSFKLDLFVDEMDNIEMKILARMRCKEIGVPVIMATDNGHSIILDVERYDLDNDLEVFNGLLEDVRETDFQNFEYRDWLSLATKIVNPQYLTERMQDSVLEIGHSIPAVPQLGSTAGIAGAAVVYTIIQIANGYTMDSGRYVFGLEAVLDKEYFSEIKVQSRNDKTADFMSKFGKK